MIKFITIAFIASISSIPQPVVSIPPVVYKSVALPSYSTEDINYGSNSGPGYDSLPAYSSGQSSTLGGQINQYQNSQSSASTVIGGFNTQGVSGNQYQNNQSSSGGSSSQSNSVNSQSYTGGSSFTKQPAVYGTHY